MLAGAEPHLQVEDALEVVHLLRHGDQVFFGHLSPGHAGEELHVVLHVLRHLGRLVGLGVVRR